MPYDSKTFRLTAGKQYIDIRIDQSLDGSTMEIFVEDPGANKPLYTLAADADEGGLMVEAFNPYSGKMDEWDLVCELRKKEDA